MKPFHNYLCLPACLIKSRGQHDILCAKCSSNVFDLFNASWTLSGDDRHLLGRNACGRWGRGSLSLTEMMTLPRA
ncbi:hypothetical protein H5410_032081, partial [Solanum commersonii]